MYRPSRYYGRLKCMVSVEHDRSTMIEEMSMNEVTALVQTIENDDLDLLESLLNISSGKSISDLIVNVNLPKRWNSVAKTVKSTPLRTAISWRNIKALEIILDSKCVVSMEDLSLALQKVLRHADSEKELEIISKLVSHGAEVENPALLTLAFERILQKRNTRQCEEIVQMICRSQPQNCLIGMLLLSVSKHSAKNQHYCSTQETFNIWEKDWQAFSINSMRECLMAGFNCKQFMLDTKVWLSLSHVSFQYLVHAMPVIVQTATQCPLEALGWLLRTIGRYYGLTSADGKDRVRQLPRLLHTAGVDLNKVMSIACLSPRFMQDTGFARWTQHQKATSISLQQRCRVVIRKHITSGNVYCAMEKLNSIPNPMKDYLLLRDVQSLPWET